MSRETRTIRPFVGLVELPAVLEATALHFGQDKCLANEGITVDLLPHEFMRKPVLIEWASDDEAFETFKDRIAAEAGAANFDTADLSLVLVASSSFLKVADIVFECPVTELWRLARVIDLTQTDRYPAFSAPFTGFTVDAYLLLSRSGRPEPLRPYLRGTWLAWSRFQVGTTQAPALLPPTPLTDEIREQHRLQGKTIRYLYFGDHDPLQPYSGQEQPVFYVDAKLLAQLNAQRNSRASRALQLQLVQDFAAAVVRRASANAEMDGVSYDDVRNSLLGSVIRIAAGPGGTDGDRDNLVATLRDSPEYVIARIEHFVDVASAYRSLLEDGDT
jgi:hypothetical protein